MKKLKTLGSLHIYLCQDQNTYFLLHNDLPDVVTVDMSEDSVLSNFVCNALSGRFDNEDALKAIKSALNSMNCYMDEEIAVATASIIET